MSVANVKIPVFARTEYLDALKRLRNTPFIKVITGIRKSGKSTLLDQYAAYLRSDGVPAGRILYLDFEDGEYGEIETGGDLYEYLDDRLPRDRNMTYIFLDEVRRVGGFEKALAGLLAKKNCDVYITSGSAFAPDKRYAEIKMFPLSFREYVSAFPEETDVARLYENYARYGAFPYAPEFSHQDSLSGPRERTRYLRSVFDSIVLKEIVTQRKFPDVAMLENAARFMLGNIGYICSANSVADIMTKTGKKISVHTVESYLSALTDSFILGKIGRYDIKGKQRLKTGCKYYAADTGLRNALTGTRGGEEGATLENIVYLELLRRGYEIHIGKVGNTEVDFIVYPPLGGDAEYYQVAYSVIDADGTALKRELLPLEAINDHRPKYLLTMDPAPLASHNGIKQINALEWLLGNF